MKIHHDLTRLPQWLLWRYELRVDDGEPTKVPYRPTKRLIRASSTEPRHWASYDFALEMSRYHAEQIDGIGFVFTANDPFCGIDLDNVWPSDAAEHPAQWAQGFVERFSDTYSEESPSGKGLKFWVRAVPPRCGKWLVWSGAGKLEVYDRDRYFTVTGLCGGAERPITDHQADLELLVAQLDTNDKAKPRQRVSVAGAAIRQGDRHNTLVSLAGTMWRRGMCPEAIEKALLEVNAKQCDPPRSPEHIRQIVGGMPRWCR